MTDDDIRLPKYPALPPHIRELTTPSDPWENVFFLTNAGINRDFGFIVREGQCEIERLVKKSREWYARLDDAETWYNIAHEEGMISRNELTRFKKKINDMRDTIPRAFTKCGCECRDDMFGMGSTEDRDVRRLGRGQKYRR